MPRCSSGNQGCRDGDGAGKQTLGNPEEEYRMHVPGKSHATHNYRSENHSPEDHQFSSQSIRQNPPYRRHDTHCQAGNGIEQPYP